jgi:hypothetical protein
MNTNRQLGSLKLSEASNGVFLIKLDELIGVDELKGIWSVGRDG